MDKKELEKINTLFAFLNDLSSQFAKKMKETDKDQNKAVVSELYEMVEDLKNTIKEKGPDLPFQQNISANYPFWLSQFKHYKLEVQPKIELPEFPKFPSKISVEEAADITDILLRIVEEVKKKDFKIDLGAVEDGLWGLQTRLAKEIDGLKKTLPKIPKFDLPMERGRVKVILPDDQVIRTPLGERVSKAIKGVFLGGETANPVVALRRMDGQQINPATAENQQTLKLNADGQLELAPVIILKTIRKTLSTSGEVIAGVTGKKIYLVSLTISCDAALTVEVSWDATPDDDEVIEAGYFAANGGLKADYSIYGPIISDVAEGLYCTITGTGNVKITAKYYQE